MSLAILAGSVLALADTRTDDPVLEAPESIEGSASEMKAPPAGESPAEAVEKPPFFEVHGFIQNNSSQRVVTSSRFPSELLKLENRAQLELIHRGPKWRFHSKTDAVWDPDNRFSRLDVREAYLTKPGAKLDLTIGKEIITWGVGDLLFLTDVFPKDWVAFITGVPIEYLKKGSVGIKADYYTGGTILEAIWIPVFDPDTLPSGKKLAFFSPFPEGTTVQQVKPASTLSNSELGLRASRMIRDYDMSFYLYSGWDRRPSPDFTASVLEYHRLGMAGLSFQGPYRDYLLSGELAYYRTEDTSGTNPAIPNPSVKWLLSLERTLKGNRVVSFQFFQELMLHHGAYLASLPPEFPQQPELETVLTARYRDTLHRETVKRTLFVLYNPTDRDYFVNAEWRQAVSDTLWYAVGLNLFGGENEWTQYGQFEKDSSLYFTVRRSF